MNAIHLVLTLAILLVNFAGLACLVERWLPSADRQIARAAGVLALSLPLFFFEHFVGLGSLKLLWPLTTLAALVVLGSRLWSLEHLRGEWPFVLPLLFAFAWRWAYPDIDANSEHLTDLYFISNYLAGETLPPPDRWLPGYRFDIYYGFLHYTVALLGRWLGVNAGLAMNLGEAVVFGLLGSLGWSVASRWLDKTAPKLLLVTALVAGGTGLAPLLMLLYPNDPTAQMWGNTRFAGLYDQQLNTPLGQALFPKPPPGPSGFEARDLPLETPSYLLYLGDVHPPIGGFVLLFFTLALLARIEKPARESEDARPLFAGLGATLLLPLAINTWVLPMQVLLLAGWAAYRWRGGQPLHARWMASGAVLTAVLLYPFLSRFAPNALGTPLQLTDTLDHTPWRQGLAIWWPVLWLVVLALLQGPKQRLLWWSACGVVALWLLCEFITVDDPNGGRFQRFNTVLKWWSWLYPAALVWLGALNLAAEQRWRRWLTWVPLLAVSLYLLPQANYWAHTPRPHAGRLQGDGWLRGDSAHRAILNWLRAAPPGLVLESVERGAYGASSAFALHAGHPSAAGWPDHVAQWRGYPSFIAERAQAIRDLYQGRRPDAAAWLKGQGVQYLVWSRFDSGPGPQALAQLKQQLANDYAWIPLWSNGADEFGVFKRLPS